MAELVWKGKQRLQSCLPEHEQASSTYQFVTKELHSPTATDVSPSSSSTHTWYNRLILGGKQMSLSALLPEFANTINLVYIDPPFMTGRTFNGGPQGEQIAYSDTWNNDI